MSKIYTESSDLTTPSSDFTTPSSDLTTKSSDIDKSFKPTFHSTPIKPSSASNASTPALPSKSPKTPAGEPTKPGNPGFNFQLQAYEGIGSPLTLQQTVNRGFRFLPKEEGVVDRRAKDERKMSAVRAILFRDEDDIGNTSKESGFFSSGSETQSCIKYVAKTNSGAPKSDSKVAKTNSDHAVEHGPSENEPGYLSKLLNSPSQARITRAGPRINQAVGTSHMSRQATDLSDKPSEKSSDSERKSAKPLPEISAKNRVQKSWKPVPDKIPKRKLDLQIERNSLYKPFQKIYSFKAKFTDKRSNRRSNSKAQLDLSDSPSSSSSYPAHQPILTHSLSDPQLEKIQLASVARHSDRDSDVSSEVSTIRSVSSRRSKLSSSRFQHTFLKPLYFEVPSPPSVSLFTGREWLYREIMEQLMSNLPTNRGVLITGGPGSGKTATILALVEQSCFGSKPSNSGSQTGLSRSLSTGSLSSLQTEGYLGSLSKTVVSYHFCQADNATTCRVPEFIHSVSAQISQSPRLSAYFHLIQVEKKVRDLLSISHCTANPSESLVSGVLEPLKLLRKTGKISGEICTIVLDGLCEAEQHRPDFGDSIQFYTYFNHIISNFRP
ncbi:uncharacterized protein LOC111695501 [Eurytemora carolleeae]|uniref:uncharacterized protein LOC111695501 n=1 Tax=Eurytemora carolleeae TaxID=1294199 RepID=UPI000C77AD78|nr:uncharacterized protein LOC111695501 [Eurytemora carolleeae]|eukprot:XP_023320622.1 uncharacterized protein LOC111695501 [Eurytemora affinis]